MEVLASELAQALHDNVFTDFGVPRGFVTGRGSGFNSSFWADLCIVSQV